MRSLVKELAERSLVASGATLVSRRLRRGQAVVLAYHNVVPNDHGPVGDRSLHLPISAFRAHLDALDTTHDVVALDDLSRASNDRGRPRAVLTFDDAYRGALELAIPELVDRGMPATVFVAPGLLEETGYWWDLLADPSTGRLDRELRQRALIDREGRQDEILHWARQRDLPRSELPPLARPAPVSTIVECAGLPGIAFGSHTWSHPNLTRIQPVSVRRELLQARDWLHAHLSTGISSWLAFPYGMENAVAREIAASSGHIGCLAGTSGWTDVPTPEPHSVPRINVPAGISRRGFRLRVSGLPLP